MQVRCANCGRQTDYVASAGMCEGCGGQLNLLSGPERDFYPGKDRSQSKRRWLILLALSLVVFVGATFAKAVLNHFFDDFKGRGENESWTVDEARDRGILVAEMVAEPSELELPGGRIRFGRAWIEERSLSTHRLVWFPAERRIGGYRLHFTLAEVVGVDPFDLLFVPDDAGHSVGSMSMWSRGKSVHYMLVASPDISELRLSVVRSWKEPLPKNIRFVPKR